MPPCARRLSAGRRARVRVRVSRVRGRGRGRGRVTVTDTVTVTVRVRVRSGGRYRGAMGCLHARCGEQGIAHGAVCLLEHLLQPGEEM